MKYEEIELSLISSNPWNPRKDLGGHGFDELVESVKLNGVIEPIIVRPKKKKGKIYEIVAGERRFKAALKAGSETIPAMVSNLTDDKAFDIMIIENLEREDLTELEEAEGFLVYVAKHGRQVIKGLAERIGFSPRYIRKRIDVMSLPKYVLKCWEKGKVAFGHLEQLLRVKDTSQLKAIFKAATRWEVWTVAHLKSQIDGLALALSAALFDLEKVGCVKCSRNSDVQKALWTDEGLKGHCLEPMCFRENQKAFLTENWLTLNYRKRFGTSGFVFAEGLDCEKWSGFLSYTGVRPTEKCKECEGYVTILHIDGRVSENKVCMGDKSCFNQIRKAQERAARGKKEATPEGGPRVAWHGEFFREEFYKTSIPAKFEDHEPSSLKIARLTLFSILRSNSELIEWYGKKAGLIKVNQEAYEIEEGDIIKSILEMRLYKVMEFTKEATLQIVLQQNTVFHGDRMRAATHLGVDLKKEWFMTEEYLQKKTIKEMLEFGKKLDIFDDPRAKSFLVHTLKKSPERYDKCKKTELIDVFLKSGVKLVGKVPEEIIPKKER